MANPTGLRLDPENTAELSSRLGAQPLQWSIVLAVRAALRPFPIGFNLREDARDLSWAFGALAIALFSAKYPNEALNISYHEKAIAASRRAETAANFAAVGASSAAHTAAGVVAHRARMEVDGGDLVFQRAATTIIAAAALATSLGISSEFNEAYYWDEDRLATGTSFLKVCEATLWPNLPPGQVFDQWQSLVSTLHSMGDHWSIWTNWYDGVLAGGVRTISQDAAFTDLPGDLPWDESAEAVNVEIAARLEALTPDPVPLEGMSSPINVSLLPDGRIGVEPGTFSIPEVPEHFPSGDHHTALDACSFRARQLMKVASSTEFQGRKEYAQMLGDYLSWLPDGLGKGNILLADGEARALTKLFIADEQILAPGFASKLSVLLEDHIGLRSFFPEIARHYHAVKTSRLLRPLPRDSVRAIQKVIQAQTPLVFDEAVSPAVDEAAKPFPEITSLVMPDDEMPTVDPTSPKAPVDPISDVNPENSRSYTTATALNKIWSILLKGKDASQAVQGWQETYAKIKPHIGAVIDFLRDSWPGGGPDGPSLPPTIGV